MSLWLRPNTGDLLCAAFNGYTEGSQYIDDTLHYALSITLGVLFTPDEGDHWFLADGYVLPDLTQMTQRRLLEGV